MTPAEPSSSLSLMMLAVYKLTDTEGEKNYKLIKINANIYLPTRSVPWGKFIYKMHSLCC